MQYRKVILLDLDCNGKRPRDDVYNVRYENAWNQKHPKNGVTLGETRLNLKEGRRSQGNTPKNSNRERKVKMPLDSTYYKDMKVSPATQLNRDEESLSILLKEKSLGIPGIEGLLVNVSKNPAKVLYKEGGVDQEIARRELIMESLKKRIEEESPRLPPTRMVQQEKESPMQGVLTFLSKLLLASNKEEKK